MYTYLLLKMSKQSKHLQESVFYQNNAEEWKDCTYVCLYVCECLEAGLK